MIPRNTISLNEMELKAVPLICSSFIRNYNSADKKIKSDVVVTRLKERGFNFNDATLRKILAHIRRNNLCKPGFIVSDSNGYWYTENKEEMKKVWKSQYSRALEIMTNFKPLHEMFKTDGSQLEFTL